MSCSKEKRPDIFEIKRIEKHARKHQHKRCFQCNSFWRVEQMQEAYASKLRIRFIPQESDDEPKILALKALTAGNYVSLEPSEIISAEKNHGWDGIYVPMDIVVKFADKNKRDAVYGRRRLIEKAMKGIKIIDELCSVRASIFREAVKFFGEARVTTAFGCIRIHTFDEEIHHIYTMEQYKDLETDERNVMFEFVLSNEFPRNVPEESESDKTTLARFIMWRFGEQ